MDTLKYYSVQTAAILGALPAAWSLVPEDIKAGMNPTVVGLIYWALLGVGVYIARKVPQ